MASTQVDDSPAVASFRRELRTVLDEHATASDHRQEQVSVMGEFRDDPEHLAEARRWQRLLAEGGWGAVTWPRELGGRDAGPLEVMAYAEELTRYDVPVRVFAIGLGMIGPTIIAHGDRDQMQRYLRPMLRGEEIWCQLWSEPDAGSDLAGLTSRAQRDGDELVLSGQKVWTSGAHYCQLGLGVFRTNPEVPKHKGISCLIVPMDTPGISVRPLRQMTGAAHFNEVFFDDARVPVGNVVGDVDDGWRVARTTMMNERLAAGSLQSATEAFGALRRLAGTVARNGATAAADPVLRQHLARVYTQGRLFDLTTARVRSTLAQGGIPGAEVSVLKLAASIYFSELAFLGAAILGPAGTLAGEAAPEGGRWADAVLGSFAMHIGGGTDEIQRNIIGETVLGLPREPSVDRDVPFRALLGDGG